MLDILVVDDEPLARQRLVRFVVDLGYEICGEASHAAEALAIIEAQDPAIILLDIEMPGETGLQLAEKIGRLDNPPAVIFVTAYDQYALDAFNTFAAGYLLKPVNREKLQQALAKAQTINKAQLTQLQQSDAPVVDTLPRHITASSHRGVDLIEVDSIRCFLADSKYITVVGTGGESLVDGTLKQLEAEFSDLFARVHRNALVSIRHIEGLERAIEGHYTIRLKDTDARPTVSRRYTSKVKALLHSL
jgi:two-component system response regulator AlgR